MEVVLATRLPPELVDNIMKYVHVLNLQKIHESLKKVKFGFILGENLPLNSKCFIYIKSRHLFLLFLCKIY